ncbi:hypothetical protein GU926_12050 [Nibribacter ruber]|uniref:Glycosyltransferase RgtA/B/C/D-like domain-containing protein n=1 Tax=Nibribacter ruber TaxID=2698458 RepID=A0A6P1NZZ2_9BACT|nr:hypothetical protein [Nibribacter ruber]QHL88124.1 hypothetical protein GU926_12050 [Nibribacter ruber]
MKTLKESLPFIIPFCLLAVLLTVWVRHNGFFWDSILLGSTYGQWYYQTNFSTLFVPQEIAGYPPLFGMYLAFGWKLFDKTLVVSHFLMLPFLLGIVWQVYLLAKRYVPTFWIGIALLLVLLDPTLVAQSAQMAPDVVLVFFYLLAINSLLRKGALLYAVCLIALVLLSPRGQIMVAALFLTDLLIHRLHGGGLTKEYLFLFCKRYFPTGIVLLLWLVLHFQHFGWVGFNRGSDWGAYATMVNLTGFFRNIGILIWRLIDFGRILLWITALVLLWQMRRKLPLDVKELILLLLVPFLTLGLILVWFTNPIAHRYWLVVYVFLGLLTARLLLLLKNPQPRWGVTALLALSLVSGHFWVYPQRIAKGWDATLAHLPYYELRKEMLHYLNQRQIPWQQVGSDFPNLASPAATDLTTDTRTLAPKDLSTQTYILYSNVFNGFTDQELASLNSDGWQVIKELRRGQVYMRLYQKK